MKAHALSGLFAAATLVALHAQTPAFPNSNSSFNSGVNAAAPTSTLQPMTAASEPFTLGQLANKPVRGPNQEQFGTVSDFLIEPQSGQVAFAVVPAGGQTYRLVPTAALDASSGQDALALRISRAQWDQAGTITEAELPAHVSLNAEQVQRTAQQFGVTGQENSAAMSNLVRATTLRGQAVRSGTDQVGTIDDVLVDVARRSAAVVLRPASGFAAAGQSVVVPFAQLQFGNEGTITTTLGRNDFSAANTNANLSPTGYVDAATSQAQASANAVQQALANNRAFAGNGVQVTTENRIVLRGTVRSAQERADVERTATQAAPGVPIDNQLTVRGW